MIAEDQSRKREMRLLKNREAARECRRKKKEYIKCLENRVAVLGEFQFGFSAWHIFPLILNHIPLNRFTQCKFNFNSFFASNYSALGNNTISLFFFIENQNKALIEELKSLKELYCQQKND